MLTKMLRQSLDRSGRSGGHQGESRLAAARSAWSFRSLASQQLVLLLRCAIKPPVLALDHWTSGRGPPSRPRCVES